MTDKPETKKKEEKQTAVANLASFLTQLGSKTLVNKAKEVVELDFSPADIAHMLKIEEGIELTDEQLDELSAHLLGNYVKKASVNMAGHAAVASGSSNQTKHANKIVKRAKGINTAADRLATGSTGKPHKQKLGFLNNQEIKDGRLTELSKGTLSKYIHKSDEDIRSREHDSDAGSRHNFVKKPRAGTPEARKDRNRAQGLRVAGDKLDKLSKRTKVKASESVAESCSKVSDSKLADRVRKAKKAGKEDKAASGELENRRKEIRKTLNIKELSAKVLGNYTKKAAPDLKKRLEKYKGSEDDRVVDKRLKGFNKAHKKIQANEGQAYELIKGKLRRRATNKRKGVTKNLGEEGQTMLSVVRGLRLKLNPMMNKKVRDSLIVAKSE